MIRKTVAIALACFALTACVSQNALTYNPSYLNGEVQMMGNKPVELEFPVGTRVKSVQVTDGSLLGTETRDNVVTLVPKGCVGVLNVTVETVDTDFHYNTHYYHVFVQRSVRPIDDRP